MKYMTIKGGKSRVRANGKPFAVPVVVTKSKKFGKVIKEESISTKQPVLITGGHDSGKTYWIGRLFRKSDLIWSKYPDGAVFLDPLRPLMAWQESPAVVGWYGKQVKSMYTEPTEWARTRYTEHGELPPWSKLKAFERQEMISEYLADAKALLFVDNCHRLTGRKQQIVKDCLIASNLYILAVSDEERLPASIRHMVLKRKPQTFRLGTDTAYDATTLMVYFAMLIAFSAGAWEISLVLGGLTALSKSKRSSRQD
ncbi:MAG: hypothetical protein V3U75_13620 [Methylococcaceae bacterium]